MDWLTDPGAIQAGLLSEAPGLALFSLRRMGKKGAALLQGWSRQAPLREICALGLGMMGLPEALPQLRKMARLRALRKGGFRMQSKAARAGMMLFG